MTKHRPKHRDLAFSAIEAGDLDMLRMRLADNPDLPRAKDLNGNSLLLAAIYRGYPQAIELLLDAAGPIGAAEAAALGRTERLAELFDAGEAAPNDTAPDGFPLLNLACMFGHPDAVGLLLDRGADLERVSPHVMGVRPAHSAAAGKRPDIVRILLDRGADPNAKQAGGWTVLHHAAQQGDLDFAKMLVEKGADAAAENDRGQKPIDIAKGLGREAVAAYFESLL
jgi:ankyrin repeat protein